MSLRELNCMALNPNDDVSLATTLYTHPHTHRVRSISQVTGHGLARSLRHLKTVPILVQRAEGIKVSQGAKGLNWPGK
jgi:hypothetical protein